MDKAGEITAFDTAKKLAVSIVIILITCWITWVSVCATTNRERISVIENGLSYIRMELIDTKSIVRDIRQDQIRRYDIERNGK